MLIDSHCHVNFNAYKEDAEEVIRRSLDRGIWLINVGSQYSTSERTIKIAEEYGEGVYAVIGLHPIHLSEDITETAMFNNQEYKFTTRKEEFDYQKYKALALSSKKIVGLGETGLDYYYLDGKPLQELEQIKNIQKETFTAFLQMGQELNLPVIFHCRGSKSDPYGAYDELLNIINSKFQIPNSKIKGVIHCFGGNLDQARRFVELGFYVGFTGVITFNKKVEELQKIVADLPLEKILVETDAPFLSPEPHRGERNEPVYVEYVAKKVAEIKKVSLETVAAQTFNNTKKLFRL
jgi:TatD DNase family protein